MFKACNKELSTNFIAYNKKSIVVNATWFQSFTIAILQKFMDEYAVSKQVFRSAANPPELHALVHKS